jgi:hypothetical protein
MSDDPMDQTVLEGLRLLHREGKLDIAKTVTSCACQTRSRSWPTATTRRSQAIWSGRDLRRHGDEKARLQERGEAPVDGLCSQVGRVLQEELTTESQHAIVAAKLANLKDGQRKVGKLADVPSQPQAAALLNVSEQRAAGHRCRRAERASIL